MERLNNSDVKKRIVKKSPYLHSPNHLLADELSTRLSDKKHFGFYLKMASQHDHNFLRKIAGEVLENANVKTPGKLFTYLVKKSKDELPKQ